MTLLSSHYTLKSLLLESSNESWRFRASNLDGPIKHVQKPVIIAEEFLTLYYYDPSHLTCLIAEFNLLTILIVIGF